MLGVIELSVSMEVGENQIKDNAFEDLSHNEGLAFLLVVIEQVLVCLI